MLNCISIHLATIQLTSLVDLKSVVSVEVHLESVFRSHSMHK